MFGRSSTKPPQAFVKSARALRTTGTERVVRLGDDNVALWLAGAEPSAQTPAIVFIHGNSACKEVFAKQMDGLGGEGYTLIAIDLPGHGSSHNAKHPDTAYTMSGYALTVKRALNHLGVTRALIVGWSLGGHVALEMVGRAYPVDGVLICGAPPIKPCMEDFASAFVPSDVMGVTGNADATDAELDAYVEALYASLDQIPNTYFAAAHRTDGRCRARMVEHTLAGDDVVDEKIVVAGWDKPVCVVHGAQDVFVSHDFMRALTWRNLWRGAFVDLPGVGHAPFAEAPEQFNDVLNAFFHEVFGS